MPIVSLTTRRTLPTFALLDDIVTVLGGTKLTFWPFIQAVGTTLSPYGSGTDGVLLTASAAIESAFPPFQHGGGIYSLKNSSVQTLVTVDNANFSFGDGTIDSPFSLGAWLLMEEAVGTARSIIAKYRTSAATAREYDFRFGTDGKLVLELYDQSAAATEIATSTGTALDPFVWQFVTMTYDGGETAPVVNLYINATSVHDGTTAETGAYVAMEDLTEVLMVGSRNSAAQGQVFVGRVALPFVTGKELTAAEVTTGYNIGRRLLGLTD